MKAVYLYMLTSGGALDLDQLANASRFLKSDAKTLAEEAKNGCLASVKDYYSSGICATYTGTLEALKEFDEFGIDWDKCSNIYDVENATFVSTFD